jgi:hypothetical protein
MEYVVLFLFVSVALFGISWAFNNQIDHVSAIRASKCPPHAWALKAYDAEWLIDGEQNLDKIANSRLQCKKCLAFPNSDPRPPTGEYE